MRLPVFPSSPMCGECGGQCCRNYAGIAWPEQFDGVGGVVERVRTGKWVVDYWEGDPRGSVDPEEALPCVLFVRPAHLVGLHPVDPSWGGVCVFLGDSGCRLTEEERPYGCRALEPVATWPHCKDHSDSKRGAAFAWLPHQDMVREAMRLFAAEEVSR
jgi:Fe-S-cluster containining protein